MFEINYLSAALTGATTRSLDCMQVSDLSAEHSEAEMQAAARGLPSPRRSLSWLFP